MAASDAGGLVREAGETRLEYAVPRSVGEGLRLARLFLFLFFAVVVFRTAWMSDDAFITLRTLDNFVNGHGLRWNVAERVNANTHPLWMFAEAAVYAVTREPYYSLLAMSFACSLAAFWIVVSRLAAGWINVVLGALALTLSQAFVDYSTSGLENPLTHLLLALFLLAYWRAVTSAEEARGKRAMVWAFVLAGMGTLNRMDTLLLFAPAIVHLLLRPPRAWKKFLWLLAAFAPFVIWELFSIVYYGSPFPNTLYAKQYAGITRLAFVEQGWNYLLDSLGADPLTLSVTAVFVLYAFVSRAHRAVLVPIALGVVLYDLYVVSVGGDFMRGRFLTAPFFCAVAALVRVQPLGVVRGLPVLAVLMLFGLEAPQSTVRNETLAENEEINVRGIADERGYYRKTQAMLCATRNASLPRSRYYVPRFAGAHVLVNGTVGVYGFYSGPAVHIVDPMGLGDPLLARLPLSPRAMKNWRIGHLTRDVPEGYIESLRDGRNRIADPDLAILLDKVSLVTRGPLFSLARFREIWKLNTGAYDCLVEAYGRRCVAAAPTYPPRAGLVNDFAGILSPAARDALEDRLFGLSCEKGVFPLVVIMRRTPDGRPGGDYAADLLYDWRVALSVDEQFIALFVSFEDRQMPVLTGASFQGRLAPSVVHTVVKTVILPEFGQGRYDNGILLGMKALLDAAGPPAPAHSAP